MIWWIDEGDPGPREVVEWPDFIRSFREAAKKASEHLAGMAHVLVNSRTYQYIKDEVADPPPEWIKQYEPLAVETKSITPIMTEFQPKVPTHVGPRSTRTFGPGGRRRF